MEKPAVLSVFLVVAITGFVAYYIFFKSFLENHTGLRVGSGLILMALCFWYFARLLHDPAHDRITALPMVRIAFAVLVYYGATFSCF
jgi:predicted tellurium resistance membrane protein TerC